MEGKWRGNGSKIGVREGVANFKGVGYV